MHPHEFDNTRFSAHTWVMYKGKRFFMIAVNFDERLFALVEEKAAVPVDEWLWVRCENVEIIKNQLIPFPPPPAGRTKE